MAVDARNKLWAPESTIVELKQGPDILKKFKYIKENQKKWEWDPHDGRYILTGVPNKAIMY